VTLIELWPVCCWSHFGLQPFAMLRLTHDGGQAHVRFPRERLQVRSQARLQG
jgi:hypothetical protein